jgi:hypothetical protein
MDQAAVQAAMDTLQSQGKSLSAGNLRKVLGYGSLRDILKYRNALLSLVEDAAEPLMPSVDGVVSMSSTRLKEKPVCLCQRCGMHRWFEHSPGDWKCELCGIAPPA